MPVDGRRGAAERRVAGCGARGAVCTCRRVVPCARRPPRTCWAPCRSTPLPSAVARSLTLTTPILTSTTLLIHAPSHSCEHHFSLESRLLISLSTSCISSNAKLLQSTENCCVFLEYLLTFQTITSNCFLFLQTLIFSYPIFNYSTTSFFSFTNFQSTSDQLISFEVSMAFIWKCYLFLFRYLISSINALRKLQSTSELVKKPQLFRVTQLFVCSTYKLCNNTLNVNWLV